MSFQVQCNIQLDIQEQNIKDIESINYMKPTKNAIWNALKFFPISINYDNEKCLFVPETPIDLK